MSLKQLLVSKANHEKGEKAMQEKNQTVGLAQRSRENIGRRKKRQTVGGRTGSDGAETETVFADSLASVRFQPKPGSKVFFETNMDDSIDKVNYMQLYNDVFACFNLLAVAKDGCPQTFNPLEKGLSLETSMDYLIRRIRDLIPPDTDFNIDREGPDYDAGGYCLTIYKELQAGDEGWQTFDVKAVLKVLFETRPSLHDIFVQFLRSFEKSTGIEMWYQMYLLERLDQQLEEIEEDEREEERVAEIKSALNDYKEGEPRYYQDMISQLEPCGASDILEQLENESEPHPVIEMIKIGCHLIKEGFGIGHFFYIPQSESDFYLHFAQQFAIMWDLGDMVTSEHETYLDADASEGVQRPVASITISRDMKRVDMSEMDRKEAWLADLYRFFELAWKAIKEVTK